MIKFQLTIVALVIAIVAGCNTTQQPQGDVQVLTASKSTSAVTLADRNELAYFDGGSTLGSGGGAAPVSEFAAVQINDSADLARFLFKSGTMNLNTATENQSTDTLVQIDNRQDLAEFHAKNPVSYK